MIESVVNTCAGCARQLGKDPRDRFYGGQHWCQHCVHTKFLRQACERCARVFRKGPTSTDTVCSVCTHRESWLGKRCARCERTVNKDGKCLPDGRITCRTCNKYFHPKKQCHYCQEMFYALSRNTVKGVLEPACYLCMHRLCKTQCCGGCRRPRVIAGEREGKGYCAACLPTGHPPVIACSDCGQQKYHFGAGRCEDCAWKRIHRRLLVSLKPQIRDLWARELFEEYYRVMVTSLVNGVTSNALRKDLPFFVAISMQFTRKSELSGVLIARRLGHEMIKKYSRPISFLSSQGIIATYDDPDYELEFYLSRIRAIVIGNSPWIEHVVQRFLSHLLTIRDRVPDLTRRHRLPTRPKSIESAVRSAVLLMQVAQSDGATAVNEISQDHLEQYIAKCDRRGLLCGRIVAYLNKHEPLFKKLKIPRRKSEAKFRGLLSDAKRDELLAFFASQTKPADVRWAMCGLFCLLYAQPVPRSMSMRLEQVRQGEDGRYQVKFAKVWIDLDQVTSNLMSQYLGRARRECSIFDPNGTNPYLFPGRRAANHATALSFCNWLHERTDATVRSMTTTSLAGWVSSRLNTQRVIVDALGVSRVTTIRYAKALGVHEGAVARQMVTRKRRMPG